MRPFGQVWLHSSDPSSAWNFAGGLCDLVIRFDAHAQLGTVLDARGTQLVRTSNPFELVDWMTANPRADCRYVGYFGYGLSRYIERLPSLAADDLRLPTLLFGRFQTGQAPVQPKPLANVATLPRIIRSLTRLHYQNRVERVLEYIAAGDIFQANFSQRYAIDTNALPPSIWRRMLDRSASLYGALIEFDDFAILSNSPELFFRVEPLTDGTRRIVNRPIKGTRPRAPRMYEALEASAKDQAELAMIVDLQRNDLGRVCEIGSVRVIDPRAIETHPTVYHGVATIEGTLRNDAALSDILRAMFPCGSITGCPKIRAMEIIDELEPVERGPYCGAIGYIDPDGSTEFNVAIRTMTIRNGVAYVPVGGGIVADSDPDEEYEEVRTKAAAMLDALGIDPTHVD